MLGIASIFPTFSKRSWFGVISRGPALFRVAHYSFCPVLKGLPELAKKHRTNHRSHNHCRFTRHRCENMKVSFFSLESMNAVFDRERRMLLTKPAPICTADAPTRTQCISSRSQRRIHDISSVSYSSSDCM